MSQCFLTYVPESSQSSQLMGTWCRISSWEEDTWGGARTPSQLRFLRVGMGAWKWKTARCGASQRWKEF